MNTIFIHVGFPKCASTSIQKAASKSSLIHYPKAGRCLDEHLGFALHFKGIDQWTEQFYGPEWEHSEWLKINEEINTAKQPLFISSERLASATESALEEISGEFADFRVKIILLIRSKERYISSTWRHAVFRHDFAMPYEEFKSKFKDFSFEAIADKFSRVFETLVFDIDSRDWLEKLNSACSLDLKLPKLNKGVPIAVANLLQYNHVMLGTDLFQALFTSDFKKELLDGYIESSRELKPLNVPIF